MRIYLPFLAALLFNPLALNAKQLIIDDANSRAVIEVPENCLVTQASVVHDDEQILKYNLDCDIGLSHLQISSVQLVSEENLINQKNRIRECSEQRTGCTIESWTVGVSDDIVHKRNKIDVFERDKKGLFTLYEYPQNESGKAYSLLSTINKTYIVFEISQDGTIADVIRDRELMVIGEFIANEFDYYLSNLIQLPEYNIQLNNCLIEKQGILELDSPIKTWRTKDVNFNCVNNKLEFSNTIIIANDFDIPSCNNDGFCDELYTWSAEKYALIIATLYNSPNITIDELGYFQIQEINHKTKYKYIEEGNHHWLLHRYYRQNQEAAWSLVTSKNDNVIVLDFTLADFDNNKSLKLEDAVQKSIDFTVNSIEFIEDTNIFVPNIKSNNPNKDFEVCINTTESLCNKDNIQLSIKEFNKVVSSKYASGYSFNFTFKGDDTEVSMISNMSTVKDESSEDIPFSYLHYVNSNSLNDKDLIASFINSQAKDFHIEYGFFKTKNSINIRGRSHKMEWNTGYAECAQWEDIASIDLGSADGININIPNQISMYKKYDFDCTDNSYSVSYLLQNRIATGYPDGTYRPNNLINRAEFTKIIAKSFKATQISYCSDRAKLTDIEPDSWYEEYIVLAQCAQLIAGYPDGTFKPGNNINAAEVAKIVSKAFNLEVATLTTGEWFMPYVNALQAVNAWPESIDSYNKEITRGEMAEIIYRVMERGTLN